MRLLLELVSLPVLAVFPIMFQYSQNLDETRFSEIARSLLGAMLLASTVLLLFRLLTKDWPKATLGASLFTVMFFSFGHVYWPLSHKYVLAKQALFGPIVATIWTGLFLAGILFLWRTHLTGVIQQFVAVLALGLSAQTIGSVAIALIHNRPLPKDAVTATTQFLTDLKVPPETRFPDIYYIILDGYGRADVLESVYGYDNSAFILFLEQQGFFVAREGLTNYNRTVLSLASSTNLDYIEQLVTTEGTKSTNYAVFDELIRDSRARRFFEGAGYQTVVISSGYQPTELTDADLYLSSGGSLVNGFERLLLRNTPLGILPSFDRFLSYEAHRQRILFALNELVQLASQKRAEPRFVFVHILSPHPPFVFGPNGERTSPERPYYLGDGNNYQGTREEYVAGYRDQLQHLNHLLAEAIEQMLLKSEIAPVIILQGDHGPGGFSDFSSPEKSCLIERAGILNAYHFPESGQGLLYDSITPVNSFRVILDTFFGTDLGLLEDKSYFGAMPYLFDPVDITDQINDLATLPAC